MNMQEDISSKKGSYGYRRLAAAIIRSGERENDQAFLNSDWCDTLRYYLKLCSQEGTNRLGES